MSQDVSDPNGSCAFARTVLSFSLASAAVVESPLRKWSSVASVQHADHRIARMLKKGEVVMAEMVINATQGVNPSFGHGWGMPLTYNGQYGSGWVAFVGGYGLQFSGQTTVQMDLDGNPIGFTVTLDGPFTVFINGAVAGTGTMPPFTYTSTLSDGDYAVPDGNGGWQLGIHGSPSGSTTPLGPFGEFVAALDRIAYNGTAEDDVFDGSHVDTSVLIHGGDGADTFYGAFRHANELYGEGGNDVLWGQGVGDYLDGGDGNDFVFDGDSAGDPTIPTPPQDTYNADTLIGGDGDDQVLSSGGGDLLDGGAGNDYLQASSDRQDDDTLIGGVGDDQIYGGLGTDTAVFSGLRSQYTITLINIGFEAYSVIGPDGSDTLVNVENARFDEGTFSMAQVVDGSGNAPAPAVFGSPINYQAGSGTSDVVAVDINSDSIIDLLAANHGGSSVSVLLGQGGGQFASAVNYSMSGGPIDIKMGDLNGDGILDMVAASPFASSITVRLGTGTGTFDSETSYPTGFGPRGVALGDFNHDGILDAAAAHANGGDLSVMFGTGTGSFGSPVQYGVGGGFPWPITAADLNKDGNLDLIVARDFISVLMGAPDGTFSAPVTYPAVGKNIISFAVDDLDNDGNLDLVTANLGTNDVSIMFGTGNGTFLPEVRYAVGAGPYAIAIADINGDGQLDIGTSNSADDTISVLINTGSGTFGPQQVLASGGDNPTAIDFSDVNEDGRMDIVVGNYDSGNVSVLLNNQLTIISDGGGVAASRTVGENNSDVTTVVAIGGQANGTLSYSIVGGADQADFQIDETSGVLRFVVSPDFEATSDEDGDNIYEVVVQASDAQGGVDTQILTVSVSNTNDTAPLFSSGSTASLAENATGTVYDADASDSDNLGSLTYLLSGTDAALFDIDAANGTVTFKSPPDFENPADADGDNVYDIVVTASHGVLATNHNVAISVANTLGGTFNGNGSNNVITGTDEEDTIRGLGGADTLSGLAGDDIVDGGNGDDVLNGGDGDDTLLGGIGRDRINGGAGGDAMEGGAGNDSYVVSDASDVVTELAGAGTDTVETILAASVLAANVENLVFVGSGNFQGTGNGLANTITGGNGDDILDGAGGADRLVGRGGDDIYMVDSVGDAVVEAAGGGRDTIHVTASSYVLGANVEVLRYSGTGAFTGTGNGLANLLGGGSGNDDLHGGAGDDELIGNEGSDEVSGGSGNDTFLATLNDGDDFYFGDGGSDTCSLAGLQVDAVVNLLNGSATSADTGTDQLTSIENAICGTGNDKIVASTARNILFGGDGQDTFVFTSIAAAGKGASADVIRDFSPGDRIDVSQLDANGALAGDPAFAFVGEITSVSGGFGQLGRGQIGYRYQTDGNGAEYTIIEGNTNATPEADFQINLVGRIQVTSGDFLL
ncbi:beta strand repeat-containing protein [Sinorhizobium fredii]|nr:FG-GAP-like repeat-containing protein [Sinorhizobium fredii]